MGQDSGGGGGLRKDIGDRAYEFGLEMLNLFDRLQSKDYGTEVIIKQLLRSGTSIGANIIEAQGGSSRRDFTNFINHALKSSNETKYWLSLLINSGRLNRSESEPILREVIELSNILGASIIKLKKKF